MTKKCYRLGYVVLYKPTHPNSAKDGTIYEHRFVMSEHLNRPLQDGECVHHKDGNRSNNSIENLELVTHSEHSRIHMYERIKDNGFSINQEKPCIKCGSLTKNKKYCSLECSNYSRRKVIRPNIYELKYLVNKYPMTTVGKMFGVSDNAIRKWLRNK